MYTENLRKFLETRPENLATQQHDQLKEYVIARLKQVITLIEVEDYASVINLTNYSPSGDGMGSENDYLDFSDVLGEGADIVTVMTKLKQLQSQSF